MIFFCFFFFFKQKTAYEIGVRLVGSEMCIRDSPPAARDTLRERGVDVEGRDTFSRLVDKALKHLVWPGLEEAVFVMDHPVELSPLAREHPEDSLLVERFQPVVSGWEIGNAFSELNDPSEQRRRFEGQAAEKAEGNE